MRRSLAVIALVALSACARQYPNRPLPDRVGNASRYTFHDRPDRAPGDPFVVMSFSGGGVRATALAYSVLDELGKYSYVAANGARRSLLDDVQVVSSTSGGSVTAAYFALHGDGNRREQLRPLVTDFIDRDNMATLEWQAANPLTWARLATPGYSRVDLVRHLFDDRLFHGATYGSIDGGGRPFVILNGTDMSSGVTFAFTPQYFDDICADLGQLPLATAVAASTAVPVVLTPITLKNYSGAACWNKEVPKIIGMQLGDEQCRDTGHGVDPARCEIAKRAKYINFEHFKRARYENALRKGPDAYGVVDYVHVVDGGLADNLGLRSLEEAVFSVNPTIPFWKDLNTAAISKFVAIVVNARAGGPDRLSQDGSTPGVVSMIGAVTGDPINIVSDTADTAFRQIVDDIEASVEPDPNGALSSYLVEVDFDLLDAHDRRQRELRDAAKAIPTSWSITHDEAATIDEAARLLLTQHPCFKLLLLDLGATPAPSVSDQDRAACRWVHPR
jgi:NTE family protein